MDSVVEENFLTNRYLMLVIAPCLSKSEDGFNELSRLACVVKKFAQQYFLHFVLKNVYSLRGLN